MRCDEIIDKLLCACIGKIDFSANKPFAKDNNYPSFFSKEANESDHSSKRRKYLNHIKLTNPSWDILFNEDISSEKDIGRSGSHIKQELSYNDVLTQAKELAEPSRHYTPRKQDISCMVNCSS